MSYFSEANRNNGHAITRRGRKDLRPKAPPACRRSGDDTQPNMVKEEHKTTCIDQHRHLTDPQACRGCVPCTERHCVVCGLRHLTAAEKYTCPRCIATMKGYVRDIWDLYDRLPDQAAHQANAPIPGGQALVLAGPTVRRRDWVTQFVEDKKLGLIQVEGTARGFVALDDDEFDMARNEPVEYTLTEIADHWRKIRNQIGLEPTVERSGRYVIDNLSWAANTVDNIDQVAAELRACIARLEDVLRDGIRPDPTGVSCTDCGKPLARRADPPQPCTHLLAAFELHADPVRATTSLHRALNRDAQLLAEHEACEQGGYIKGDDNVPYCTGCGRQYTKAEYELAYKVKLSGVAVPS